MQSFKITIDQRDFIVLCLPGRPKALLDRTVAEIYEVTAKRTNEAVRRNPEKFPEDFFFELTLDETRVLNEVANCDLDWKGGHLPKAFTHLGCNMLATILKSPRAVQQAIQIIRTFTALESGGYDKKIFELQIAQAELKKGQEKILEKLEEMEKKYDTEIGSLKRDLHILLWEGEMETSPFIQTHRKIRALEEKLDTVMMDGRFRRLQLQTIYSDVCQFREHLEKEIEEGKKKEKFAQKRLYFHDEELRCIKSEVERIEKKIEILLLERKGKAKKKDLLPISEEENPQKISAEEAQELRDFVHKKARGKGRKKIGEIWSLFKRHFHLTRYKHLPADRFDEALMWLKKNI